MHPEVITYWPELAPIVALHLSNDHGVPMYAEANGWYQLAGYYGGADERYHAGNSKRQVWRADGTFDAYREPTPSECLSSWAAYVRIPRAEAEQLAARWYADDDTASMKRWHREWILTQYSRWQVEADAAIALLDELNRQGACIT